MTDEEDTAWLLETGELETTNELDGSGCTDMEDKDEEKLIPELD